MPDETIFEQINPVIPVRDMADAVSYYEGQLGFVMAFDDAGGSGAQISYAGMARGGICIHLQSMAPGESPTMPLVRIKVTNIEPLYREYNARGLIGPTGHLEPKPWGSKEFGVYDLNGAALVFYEDI